VISWAEALGFWSALRAVLLPILIGLSGGDGDNGCGVPGVDYVDTVLGLGISLEGRQYTTITFNTDGIAALQSWVNDPTSNGGLLLHEGGIHPGDFAIFASRESSDPPVLSVSTVPEPATLSLLLLSRGLCFYRRSRIIG
jgi:hypothetical protein